nr:hypothetical protein HK105_007214 [Polyrhizophydium stewartii]
MGTLLQPPAVLKKPVEALFSHFVRDRNTPACDGHHAQAFVDLTLSQRAFYADGGEPGSFPANDPAHASIDLISDDESLGSVIVARQSAVLINLLDSDSDEVEFVGSLSPEIASDMITPCDLNELDLKIDDIGPPKRSLPALLMSREYLADALGHYEVQKIYETLETRSLTQWKRQIVYKFGSGGTTSLCFSPNAQMLLSTHSALTDTYNEPGNFICADIGLRRWSDREPAAGAKAGVSQMVVLSDDAFAAGSVGGAVYIWRDEAGFSTPECLRAKPEESVESFRAVSTVYVQPDLGPNILFAGYEQPALQARKDGNASGIVYAIGDSPTDQLVRFFDLRFWDVRRQNPLLNHIDDFDGSISSLALSFGWPVQLSVDELEALDRRQRAATHASALQASTRSKHECYHASVQLPQEEVKSLSNMYQTVQRAVRRAGMRGGDGDLPPSDDDDTDSEADGADSLDAGRESLNARRMAKRQAPPVARTFLEDFCGTAVLADAWAGMHATHEAFGIDIDPAVIAHARAQTLQHAHSARVHVSVGNVLEPTAAYGVPPVDLIAALNYGVFYHHRRADLVKYLRRCADALNHGGVLIVDCFGGARVSSVEGRLFKRRFSDFTYFFEQKPMDALSSIVHVHLHFRFDDGSWLKNAFTYEFRVYTIREIREAMLEAGFARTFVWIDVADRASEDDSDDEADEAGGTFKDRDAGVYEYKLVETLTVPQLESFNAYIAAVV